MKHFYNNVVRIRKRRLLDMTNRSQLLITIILFLSFISSAVAQVETDWPVEGYNAYFNSDGNSVLLRDPQGNCSGKINLITPWLAQLDNIEDCFLYEEKHEVRWKYIDSNNNGVIDKIFYEDFSAYEFVDNPDIPPLPSPYNVYGLQRKGAGLSNGIHAYFDTIEEIDNDPIPSIPTMIIGDDFDSPLNLKNAYMVIDLETKGIYEAVEKVISPAVKAKTLNNRFLPPQEWRLQNYPYEISRRNNPQCLYPLPSSKNGTIAIFDINDFVRPPTEQYFGKTGNFTYVNGFSFYLLQTASDSSGTINDWDEKGSIKLNSVAVSKDYQPNGSTPLDTEIFISGVKANSFTPKNKVTVSLDIFKKGDVTETVTDIVVFDSTFNFTNINDSKIYDSSMSDKSIETHIGLGEIETVNFSFYIPENAPQGNYKIWGVIKDQQGNILDTTGPDTSLNDNTIMAYIESFTVIPYEQEGPVALFDHFLEDQGNGNVTLTLFAGMSFNYSSQNYQITRYEWDLDNDGHFEYESGSPSQPVVFTSVDNSFIKPVALRVTNNHDPAQSAVTSKIVRIGRFGDLEINTSLIDNDSTANAKCLLYDSQYNYISSKIVNASSIASWENLIEGNYIAEVYVYKNNLFPSIELASVKEISVTGGTTSSYTINQPVFNIISSQICYADTGMPINPLLDIAPDTDLKLDITVENNSCFDLYARTKLMLDQDRQKLIDLNVNLSDKIFVPSGEQATISTFFNLKQPESYTDFYYYAFMIETEKNLMPVKVYEQNWQMACGVKRLPGRTVKETINFCGHEFDVIRISRFSGLSEKNVWFSQPVDNEGAPSACDPQGVLNLRVQDYSGVGGEVTPPSEQYHYGIYKAEMKVDGQATTLPEGTVAGFFYYWQRNGEDEIQEIDVELRSLDKTKKGISSYASFTVHSKKTYDSKIHHITHFCPVENIEQYHTYEFRWSPGEVAFYIDGLPAYNFNGEKVVINEQSIDSGGELFTGRIPDQPGRLIMNHWSGYWNNTWSGAPPQGKGDSIFKIARLAYIKFEDFNGVAGLNIEKTQDNKIKLKLKKGFWPIGCDIYAADIFHNPLEWEILEENVALSDKNGYTDHSSAQNNLKYYKVIPK